MQAAGQVKAGFQRLGQDVDPLRRKPPAAIGNPDNQSPHTAFSRCGQRQIGQAKIGLATRQAQARGDLTLIANHLKNLKGAKAEWQQARYGSESLYQWVLEQTELSDAAFQRKFLSGKAVARLRDVEAALEPALKAEYIARLIDGVLKLAVTQARAEKEGLPHG